MSQSTIIATYKRLINKDNILNISFLLLCLVPVLLSFVLVTNGEANALKIGGNYYQAGMPCLFHSVTGYNCLTCGMTRCFIYMSDFNIKAAWDMNVAGVLLYMFCLLQIPYRVIVIFQPQINKHRFIVLLQYLLLVIIGTVAVIRFVVQFFHS